MIIVIEAEPQWSTEDGGASLIVEVSVPGSPLVEIKSHDERLHDPKYTGQFCHPELDRLRGKAPAGDH